MGEWDGREGKIKFLNMETKKIETFSPRLLFVVLTLCGEFPCPYVPVSGGKKPPPSLPPSKKQKNSLDTGRVRTCASEENRYQTHRFPISGLPLTKVSHPRLLKARGNSRRSLEEALSGLFKSVALTTRPQCRDIRGRGGY